METEDNRPVVPTSDKWKPWLRWLARTLDYVLAMIIGGIVVGVICGIWFHDNPVFSPGTPLGIVSITLIGILLWTLCEGGMLTGDGGTPGKKLLGILVRKSDGEPLDEATARRRAWLVWWNGVATGLPIAFFVMQFVEYRRLRKTGKTSWDERLGLEVVFVRKPLINLVIAIGILAVLMVFDVSSRIDLLKRSGAMQRGIYLLNHGRDKDAEREFDLVEGLGRLSADFHYNRGLALQNQGKYEQAAAAYEKALELNKRHLNALNNLGLVYGELDRHEDALECFEKGLKIDSEHELLLLNIGNPLRQLKQYDKAVKALKKAHRLYPKESGPMINLGYTYGDMERFEDAIEAFKTATELEPGDSSTWYGLGTAYEDVDNRMEAYKAYQQGTKVNPRDADCYYRMGMLQSASFLPSPAAKNFEKVIELDPGNDTARYLFARACDLYDRREDVLEQYCALAELESDWAPELKEKSEITDEEIERYRQSLEEPESSSEAESAD